MFWPPYSNSLVAGYAHGRWNSQSSGLRAVGVVLQHRVVRDSRVADRVADDHVLVCVEVAERVDRVGQRLLERPVDRRRRG